MVACTKESIAITHHKSCSLQGYKSYIVIKVAKLFDHFLINFMVVFTAVHLQSNPEGTGLSWHHGSVGHLEKDCQ